MKYFDDMGSKWGFDDGDAMPNGVQVYREVYIRTINHFAALHSSEHRAVPVDRPGMHNSCLISYDDLNGKAVEKNNLDTGMRKAIQDAYYFNPDEYVHVRTTCQRRIFDATLRQAKGSV